MDEYSIEAVGCVINQWFRLRSMEVNRLNHRVFKWAYMQGNKRYKNGAFVLNINLVNLVLKTISGMLVLNI